MPVRDSSVALAPTPPYRGLHLVPDNPTRVAATDISAANLLYRATTIVAALYLIVTSF